MNTKNITLKKKITLIWHKRELEELDNFFNKEGKGLGGLYLWIFKGDPERKTPDCIRYIGEAQNFKERFNTHFRNVAHGLYTAVNCKNYENLRNKYSDIADKKEGEADNLFYEPKNTEFIRETLRKAKFKSEILREYVNTVKDGIQLNLEGFLNCYFLFAEIAEIKSADISRKEVESIFMHKTKVAYLGGIDKKCWWKWKENHAFWGTVSEKYDKNCQYTFTNEFPEDEENTRSKVENILESIDIKLNGVTGDTWTFFEENK